MNGLNRAQYAYDRQEPQDSRNDLEIEIDAAARLKTIAKKPAYVYDETLWARVTEARLSH